MIKTYIYKLKPNKAIEQKFDKWVGVCRFVYNCSKDLSEQSYKKGVPLTCFGVQKQLVIAKKEFTWVSEVHSQTLQLVIEKYFNSMKRFFKGAGYPKWAKKHKWRSLPFKSIKTTFKSIKTTFNGFKLPSFGSVKVFNFKVPKGELRTASIIREVDGLYLKVVVREENTEQIKNNGFICGIDMGVDNFLTTSDGEVVDNPKHLFNYLKELRIENRKLSRMKRGGNNYKKQVRVLQRLYLKISRVRKDFLHKESRKLANNYPTVIREDLNISKMIKGSKLAKHILDCSWGTFFLMLEYKTNVVKVNPAYTSQKCNLCIHTAKENRKTQSLFECVKCGHIENADLNASKNILELGQQLIEANVEQ